MSRDRQDNLNTEEENIWAVTQSLWDQNNTLNSLMHSIPQSIPENDSFNCTHSDTLVDQDDQSETALNATNVQNEVKNEEVINRIDEAENSNREVQKLAEKLKDTQEALFSTREEHSQTKFNSEDLQEKYRDKSKKLNREKRESYRLNKENVKLRMQKSRLLQQNWNLTKEKKDKKRISRQPIDNEKRFHQKYSYINKVLEENYTLRSTVESLREKNKEQQNDIDRKKDKLNDLLTIEKKVREYQRQIHQSQLNNERLNRELQQSRNQCQTLQKNLRQKHSHEKEIEKLRERTKEKSKDDHEKNRQLSEYKKEIKKIRQENQLKDQHVKRLQNFLEEEKKKARELNADNLQLKKRIEKLTNQTKEECQHQKSSQKIGKKKKSVNQRLTIEEYKRKEKRLQKEIAHLTQELKKLKKDTVSKKDLERMKTYRKEEYKKLLGRFSQERKKTEMLETKVKHSQKENQKIENIYKKLKENSQAIEISYAKQYQILKKQFKSLQVSYKQLEKDNILAKKILSNSLESSREKKEKDIYTRSHECKIHGKMIVALLNTVDDVINDKIKVSEKNEKLNEHNKQLLKEIDGFKASLNCLNEILFALIRQNADLKNKKKQHTRLENNLDKIEKTEKEDKKSNKDDKNHEQMSGESASTQFKEKNSKNRNSLFSNDQNRPSSTTDNPLILAALSPK